MVQTKRKMFFNILNSFILKKFRRKIYFHKGNCRNKILSQIWKSQKIQNFGKILQLLFWPQSWSYSNIVSLTWPNLLFFSRNFNFVEQMSKISNFEKLKKIQKFKNLQKFSKSENLLNTSSGCGNKHSYKFSCNSVHGFSRTSIICKNLSYVT